MKKWVVFLLFGLLGILDIFFYYRFMESEWRAPNRSAVGIVIILNGPSAAGKSSIQRAFQRLMMPQLWIKLGIDSLFDGPMPDIDASNLAYWQATNPIRWVQTTSDAHGNTVVTLHVGVLGQRVVSGMNAAIAAYAKAGNCVIVDYIAYEKKWIDDLRAQLRDLPSLWVKVDVPLAVLEERETARGTSPKGHARSHYDQVHWDVRYDLVLDGGKLDPAAAAVRIKEAVQAKAAR